MTETEKLHKALLEAGAIVIGAGAGLSTSAGFTYSGERFQQHFADFIGKYGFTDMYTAAYRRQGVVPGFGQRRQHARHLQNPLHPLDDAEPERHLRHRQPRRGVHRGPDRGPVDCNQR